MKYQGIIGLLARAYENSQKFIEKELAKAELTDLLPSHGAVLAVLYRSGGSMRMNEIAKTLGRDKSTVTTITSKMEQNGYITKCQCEKDGRAYNISLAEKAYNIKPLFDGISQKLVAAAYSGMTEEEEIMLKTLLEKVRDNYLSEMETAE